MARISADDTSRAQDLALRSHRSLGCRGLSRVDMVLTARMIERLRIAVSGPDQEIASLSGGNQQKVVIARWMLEDADLYIFDEPTKGVDVGAKEEIYRLMVELAREGKSIVMISSDMPELLSMSDRIGIMRGGRMVRVVDNAGIDEQVLIKEFIGI